jgi:hypothetical protein
LQSQEGSVLHRVAVFKTSGVALAGRARAQKSQLFLKQVSENKQEIVSNEKQHH